MEGKLIVWEGIEGSGKTTQIPLIAQWLREFTQSPEILVTREPGGTSLGQQIRELLLKENGHAIHQKTELCLFAADRIQHLEEVIRPALARGMIVLCDRFTASTIAYQCYGRGLEYSLVEQFNQLATNGLTPDLTIWLKVDVKIGLQRIKLRGQSDSGNRSYDRLEKENLEFHQRVHQGYQDVANRNPRNFIPIDASQSPEFVTQETKKIIEYARLFT